MAERLYFPLKRNTTGDADRVVDDPIGNFSCLLVTAKFLDIENLAKPFLPVKTVKPTKIRTLNRADGSTVTRSTGNTSGIPAEYEKVGRLSRGTRRVTLTTGKKIDARVGTKATYHTISFRFPAFATILVISDALGTLIPSAKIKANPTADDVSPYFKVYGGGRYPIMQKAAANSRTDAVVALTAQQVAALSGGGISFIPGAGV